MSINIVKLLDFFLDLVGRVKYKEWDYRKPACSSYNIQSYASNSSVIPSKTEIIKHGMNCVGIINLMRRMVNKNIPGVKEKRKFAGSTSLWFNYLKKNNLLKKFDSKTTYPVGTLLIRNYTSRSDEGHVAVIFKEDRRGVLYSKLIHCAEHPNHLEIDLVVNSYSWLGSGYYTHVSFPEDWLFKSI